MLSEPCAFLPSAQSQAQSIPLPHHAAQDGYDRIRAISSY